MLRSHESASHLTDELLNHARLLRATPDHGVVSSAKQKPNGHDGKAAVSTRDDETRSRVQVKAMRIQKHECENEVCDRVSSGRGHGHC